MMMGVPLQTAQQPAKLAVMLASNTGEIEQAMRLRYQVFVEERWMELASTRKRNSI